MTRLLTGERSSGQDANANRTHALGRGAVDQQAKILARETLGHRIASTGIEQVIAHLHRVQQGRVDNLQERCRVAQPRDAVKAHLSVSLELPKGGDAVFQYLLGSECRFSLTARRPALYDVVVELNQVHLFSRHADQTRLD